MGDHRFHRGIVRCRHHREGENHHKEKGGVSGHHPEVINLIVVRFHNHLIPLNRLAIRTLYFTIGRLFNSSTANFKFFDFFSGAENFQGGTDLRLIIPDVAARSGTCPDGNFCE
jgi:hypothetical protein